MNEQEDKEQEARNKNTRIKETRSKKQGNKRQEDKEQGCSVVPFGTLSPGVRFNLFLERIFAAGKSAKQ